MKSRQHAGFLNSCCTCTWCQWRRRCDSNSGCVISLLFFTLIFKAPWRFFHSGVGVIRSPIPCPSDSHSCAPLLSLHPSPVYYRRICHFLPFEFLVSQFWASVPLGESSWRSARLSAGVSGGKVQELPATWRGRGRAAEGSLRQEPPDCLRDHSSKVRRRTWWGKLPWEQRQWQDPREQLGSRVPAQRQGWNGSELRFSPAGLCWRRRPAGC